MSYAALGGGKRLRGILALTFARAVAGRSRVRCADDAAVAVELIHAYSLVHDDLPAMDDAALRRGKASCHMEFGEANAILTGDALLTEALSALVSTADGQSALRADLARELSRAAGWAGMVGGQVLDMRPRPPTTVAALRRIHRMKTGAIIEAACRMGALCGGASAAALDAASKYGSAVGLAFQIADDVLDGEADAATLGKTPAADAANGKVTYLTLLGAKRARALAERHVKAAVQALRVLRHPQAELVALARFATSRSA